MRKIGISSELKDRLKEISRFSKGEYRDQLRSDRDVFKPIFKFAETFGVHKLWPDLFKEMEDEGYISLLIKNLLEQEGYAIEIPKPDLIDKVPYRYIACAAAWIEYYLAIFYLAFFEKGKIAKTDFGDQIDFRHACYAGLANIFVNGDQRMFSVLADMVETKRSII